MKTSGFGQWKERVKTGTICGAQSACVSGCRKLCVCMYNVCVWWQLGKRERGGGYWMLILTDSPPGVLRHVCK